MSLLQYKRRKRPEMNLLPLIDVLVMLVFFAFVTMQFKSAATLNLTLPKVETAGKNEFRGSVTIGIDKDGSISVNGKPVPDDQLQGILEQVKNIDRTIPVLIKADETTPLKKLAFVMDACRLNGLNGINLQSR